jgi:predicted O-methyltransferase YrrM
VYASESEWRDVDSYFADLLVTEDEALLIARESSQQTTMPTAEVAPNQGKLLALLCQITGAGRVLEFGTLAGYSTIWLARAAGKNGRVTTLELEEQNAAIARSNLERAGVSGQVDVIVGPAVESARKLIADGEEPYDFVFIDADKPSNPAYLEASLALTHAGSVIVIDNVVRGGAVIDPGSPDARVQGVRAVLADIAENPRLEATALQTVGLKGWDGFTIARRTRLLPRFLATRSTAGTDRCRGACGIRLTAMAADVLPDPATPFAKTSAAVPTVSRAPSGGRSPGVAR